MVRDACRPAQAIFRDRGYIRSGDEGDRQVHHPVNERRLQATSGHIKLVLRVCGRRPIGGTTYCRTVTQWAHSEQ